MIQIIVISGDRPTEMRFGDWNVVSLGFKILLSSLLIGKGMLIIQDIQWHHK